MLERPRSPCLPTWATVWPRSTKFGCLGKMPPNVRVGQAFVMLANMLPTSTSVVRNKNNVLFSRLLCVPSLRTKACIVPFIYQMIPTPPSSQRQSRRHTCTHTHKCSAAPMAYGIQQLRKCVQCHGSFRRGVLFEMFQTRCCVCFYVSDVAFLLCGSVRESARTPRIPRNRCVLELQGAQLLILSAARMCGKGSKKIQEVFRTD